MDATCSMRRKVISSQTFLLRKPEWKTLLRKNFFAQDDDVKINIKEVLEGVEWMHEVRMGCNGEV